MVGPVEQLVLPAVVLAEVLVGPPVKAPVAAFAGVPGSPVAGQSEIVETLVLAFALCHLSCALSSHSKPENQTKNIRIDRTCFPSVPIIFLDECPPINLVCFKNRKTKTSTIYIQCRPIEMRATILYIANRWTEF